MSEKRRGLGKGLGALIPTAPTEGRPVDVFFPSKPAGEPAARAVTTSASTPAAVEERPARSANARTTTTATTKSRKRPSIPKDTVNPGRKTETAPEPEPAAPSAPEPAPEPTDAADTGGLAPVPGASFAEVGVHEVIANRRQPRQVFDEDELEELASSIREVGVLQPIVVRPLPEGEGARYELIMGERRWRATQLAGLESVPAIIRHVEDNDLLRDALLENLHRAQLNPLEEAAAYQQLLEDFECTHEELASRIARSRPQISNTLRLLKLPALVQRRVAAGVLSAGHARALLGLSDPAAMERLAQRIVAEGLSVRTTEEIVALGDEPTAPEMRRRPRGGAHVAELNELATRLADRFDTRVKIGMGQRKGRINIEFASLEDLNRILDVLAPNVERPALEN
ncbi:ParB/RepB/Spo0J family partition protein [Georgenia wutianyii]|uniref:ParB/RepB/Spo0J family partition protein n=1 Tax=Georgenia wutianyii TaxID=2585135 RepID=A0ABX5VRS2_9MICO|nr:ParB/RepB/Spo0J family partition protein [Georgenia wutianyii]QDB80586.1 ParB/RepB/Spo0J family partition protein [Georgenia wutianyii]